MERNFREAMIHRRTYYRLGKREILSHQELHKLMEAALLHVPSAFNSQSARLVLLLGEQHDRLWQIVKDTLRPLVPADAFVKTEEKIDQAFASGYGTVLFYEDQDTVKQLQEQFPLYKDNFPTFSEHSTAMHQFAVWTMLEDAGLGASLQHYNPLIDEAVAREWQLPASWKLTAQMPFGSPECKPDEKTFLPLDGRLKMFE